MDNTTFLSDADEIIVVLRNRSLYQVVACYFWEQANRKVETVGSTTLERFIQALGTSEPLGEEPPEADTAPSIKNCIPLCARETVIHSIQALHR